MDDDDDGADAGTYVVEGVGGQLTKSARAGENDPGPVVRMVLSVIAVDGLHQTMLKIPQ